MASCCWAATSSGPITCKCMIAACSASARQLVPPCAARQGSAAAGAAGIAWLAALPCCLALPCRRSLRSLSRSGGVAFCHRGRLRLPLFVGVAAACSPRSPCARSRGSLRTLPLPRVKKKPPPHFRAAGASRSLRFTRKNNVPRNAEVVNSHPAPPSWGRARVKSSALSSARGKRRKPCAALVCLGARGGPPLRRPFPPCAPLSPPYPPLQAKGCLLPMRGARALNKGGSSARQCPPLSGAGFGVRCALPLSAGAGWSRSALLRLLPIRARALGVQRPIAARCASWLGARCTAAQRLRERSACALLGALRARLIEWLRLFARLRQLISERVRHRSALVPMV